MSIQLVYVKYDKQKPDTKYTENIKSYIVVEHELISYKGLIKNVMMMFGFMLKYRVCWISYVLLDLLRKNSTFILFSAFTCS